MELIATNGGMTSCVVRGEGPPLVFLHGFEGDHRVWDDLATMLSDRFTVIAYDQREKGATTFSDESYTMEDLADDFSALLDGLGIERAHVCGTSFGGALAQMVGLRHPQRVERLVVAATGQAIGDMSRLHPEIPELAARISQGDRAATQRMAELYFHPHSLVRDPSLLTRAMAHRPVHTPEQIGRRMAALQGFDSRGRLGAIEAPTLVIQGQADPVSIAAESLAMALEIPKGSFVLIAGVGHAWQTEDPAFAVDLLTVFLTTKQ
jgi:3-oxoadipate enol-lactonase